MRSLPTGSTSVKLIVDSEVRGTTLQKLIMKVKSESESESESDAFFGLYFFLIC